MVEVHPQKLDGRWKAGVALDFHTTSSTPLGDNEAGHMQFDTVRPPIAQLLYQLKYKGDQSAAAGIIAGAVGFLSPYAANFDLIVPVPASTQRAIQPVVVLANGIGSALKKPVAHCVTSTRPTTQLKGVIDPAERAKLVAGLYAVDARQTWGKKILLFDDLYRSGTTLNAITEVLLAAGQAESVRVLTVTRTRSNR